MITNKQTVMNKKVFAILFSFTLMMALPLSSWGKIIHLLPQPKQVTASESAAPITLTGSIRTAGDYGDRITFALDLYLGQALAEEDNTTAPLLTINYVTSIAGAYDYTLAGYENEAYQLSVGDGAITINAVTETGALRAIQTLGQLAEGYDDATPQLEACQITDWPSFKLRGYMHDVGRSFISFDELVNQVKLFSRFKVNTFHWHLTENQAWRFEVKALPALTASSSMTRFAGQYYTQEQCAYLDSIAWLCGVSVIPEIDMPGHSGAFQRAMGHSMQTDQGVKELQTVLTEAVPVFKHAPYIHIGGDEVQITYTNFLKIMIDTIHALGQRAVLWNRLQAGAPSKDLGMDMTQMWATSGRAVSGVPNIDCRYNYINHFDVFADLVGIYKSNIYYAQQGNADLAGEICATWNDRKTPTEEDIINQNNVIANVIASATRAWKGGGEQYIEVGGTTLPNSGSEYEDFKDFETRFLFHKAHSLSSEPIPYVRQSHEHWAITDAFPNGGDASATLPPETEGLQNSYTLDGQTYTVGRATGAGIYLRHTWGTTVPSYYSNPQTNTTAYAWTYIYSPVAQTVGAQIEFQNYGRSENDSDPDNGKWDKKGSRVWVNDVEILPPTWTNAGKSINSEVDLGNENFSARTPVSVTLQQGWNKVFLKLPYVSVSGVRLNKWMFTFALTDAEGKNAVDGLVYSPNKVLDENADAVADKIIEIRRYETTVIGTLPGYYPVESAATLDSLLSSIEATLPDSLTATQRQDQLTQLDDALAAFKTYYPTTEMNQPTASTDTHATWYRMYTPLRNSRAMQSAGAGQNIVGATSTGNDTYWKFVKRTDGSFDIINRADGTYISPASSYNTALKSSATAPTSGWTVKPADEPGYFILSSGSVQINQTTFSPYPVYNWGGGSNTSDTGCKYAISNVDEEDIDTAIRQAEAAAAANPGRIYDLQGRIARPNDRGILIERRKKIIR